MGESRAVDMMVGMMCMRVNMVVVNTNYPLNCRIAPTEVGCSHPFSNQSTPAQINTHVTQNKQTKNKKQKNKGTHY